MTNLTFKIKKPKTYLQGEKAGKAATPASPTGTPQGDAPSAGQTPPHVFSNESNGVALRLSEIRKHLALLAKGWPKVAAGLLCYRQKDSVTGRKVPVYLQKVPELFSWIDRVALVDWATKRGRYTKEEFLAHLLQRSKRYKWATDLPHSPALPEVLYTNKAPQPANTGRLDAFVDMFSLHSDIDRVLVKAFILTPFWGGPPGKRPLFVFAATDGQNDQDAGRGAGKSTIAQTVGRLCGGCMRLHNQSDADRVLSDLLSPSGLPVRMVLLDNVKQLKFSDPFLEALITADAIDGHRLYGGHESRPNYLTYALTANEPTLSKDLATRSIPILVKQPKKSPQWEKTLEAMLANRVFLKELLADILWHLQQPVQSAPEIEIEYDRWPLWWSEVVSRICPDPGKLLEAMAGVKKRRGIVDGDLSEREAAQEAIRGFLLGWNTDPDAEAAFIPTKALAPAMSETFGRRLSTIEVGRRLKSLQLPNLRHTADGPPRKQSGFWWIGPNSAINTCRGIATVFTQDHTQFNGWRKDSILCCELFQKLGLPVFSLKGEEKTDGGPSP